MRLVWLNQCPSSAVPFPECVTMDEDNYNVDLESKDATYLMQSVGIPESRRREVNPIALAGDIHRVWRQSWPVWTSIIQRL